MSTHHRVAGATPAWAKVPPLVPFSLVPLFAAVALRPAIDALYEVNAVKYVYMFLVFFGVLLARAGMKFSTFPLAERNDEQRALAVMGWTAAYFWYLVVLLLSYNGSLQDCFKITSPFLIFALLLLVPGRWFQVAAVVSSVLIILANAALLPTSFGWIWWGDVKTFKGFYYFKTDLAYSLCFAVLICAYAQRYRLTLSLVALIAIAAVQVVLCNSRINYLTFALVTVFIGLKGGMKPSTIVRMTALTAIAAGAFFLLFDSKKFLSFDTSNVHAFTQGRDLVWDILIKEGLSQYSPLEWLFGRGLFADTLIFAGEHSQGEAHNAHNEFLHLLTTQGLVGVGLYLTLWLFVFRQTPGTSKEPWQAGTREIAFFLLLIQSITAAISLSALKTWPVIAIMLLLRSGRADPARTLPTPGGVRTAVHGAR